MEYYQNSAAKNLLYTAAIRGGDIDHEKQSQCVRQSSPRTLPCLVKIEILEEKHDTLFGNTFFT